MTPLTVVWRSKRTRRHSTSVTVTDVSSDTRWRYMLAMSVKISWDADTVAWSVSGRHSSTVLQYTMTLQHFVTIYVDNVGKDQLRCWHCRVKCRRPTLFHRPTVYNDITTHFVATYVDNVGKDWQPTWHCQWPTLSHRPAISIQWIMTGDSHFLTTAKLSCF